MKLYNAFLLIASFILLLGCGQSHQTKLELTGEWHFASDPNDEGIQEQWYTSKLKDQVTLPGSMNSNGKGNDVNLQTEWTGGFNDSSFFKDPEYAEFRQPDNFKIPYWLQPLKHYQGAAWYQKEVDIPGDWDEKQIILFLERVHWESRLWIDDQQIGMRNGLGAPHRYELTTYLTPGKHLITLRIDNRVKEIDPGENSHSISDHTQTNWNGMIGEIYLEAHPPVRIEDIQVYPDVKQKKITAEVTVNNATGQPVEAGIQFQAKGKTTPKELEEQVKVEEGTNRVSIDYPMGDDVALWDEFHPNLYELQAKLTPDGKTTSDSYSTTFGMRSFTTDGRQIQINGRPVYLRGTLECAIFPQTGYPATDTASWGRIFRIIKKHGLNHMRFHSWCPPEAAFIAADKAGIYLQPEASSWANQSTTLGDGKPIDQFIYEESKRIVREYGNHPSFVMMAYGNEPGGPNHRSYLREYVNYWKDKDKRRIYTSAAGWPILPVNEFLSHSAPRIQGWGEELSSIINSEPPRTDYDWSDFVQKHPQPVVSHEIGQWCVYPNFKEIDKYDGVMRARNFEIFRETLEENGMAHLADSFLLASGKLQALGYKADIEAALRTEDFGGFQLLDLHDFPGQGTALVGVLDPFWDEKGYITAEEYSRFSNTTVPLARMSKRIFTNDESFTASVEVAHFGERPIQGCIPEWEIRDAQGNVLTEGTLPKRDIPLANGIGLGEVSWPLQQVDKPQKLTFECSVESFSNSWEIWVYPSEKEKIENGPSLRVVQQMDQQTFDYLQNGGNVLFTLEEGTLPAEMGGDIGIGFSSIFWNTAWTRGQAPHTLGILCDPEHPALADFPTDYHSDWQWWDAMSHSNAIILSEFSKDLKPIVRVIDDWFTNRPLGLIMEAKVGEGKVLIAGVDLQTNLEKRPEAQQLLYSLKKYMAGERFDPRIEMKGADLQKLM